MQIDSFVVIMLAGCALVLLICYAVFGFVTESIRSVHNKYAEEEKKKRQEARQKALL